MKEKINSDLKSLWDKNFLDRAHQLNLQLNRNHFDTNTIPMHFTGNPEAKTVLIMLNPGFHKGNYDFSKTNKHDFKTIDQFISRYMDGNKQYGEENKGVKDNFDQKQAAFLYEFDDHDLQIPRVFWESPKLLLDAKRNVLMNKYQLELIPFCSSDFKDLLSNAKQAKSQFLAFEPYLQSILDEISQKERKYIVFCSRKFYHLFLAAESYDAWKDIFTLSTPSRMKEGNLSLSCIKVKINYQGHSLNAIIANSFPSRALPNAYKMMANYGKFCLKEINSL